MELKIYTDLQAIPREIKFNNEEIVRELNLDELKNFSIAVSGVAEARRVKKSLTDLKERIAARTKEIKELCLAPYERMKEEINIILKIIEDPIALIDSQLKEESEKEKESKRRDIEAYFSEKSPFGNFIELDHPRLWDDRWLNKTFSMAAVRADIDTKIELVRNGLDNIEHLECEFMPQIKDVFLRTFDLNAALAEKKRLEQQRAREEEYRRRKSEIKVVSQPILEAPKPTVETLKLALETSKPIAEAPKPTAPTLYTFSFQVTATRENLIKLKEFFTNNNINYIKL
jgi:hypothetical protein